MARILIFSGPPASGKTTLCKSMIRLFNQHHMKSVYMSDAIILERIIALEKINKNDSFRFENGGIVIDDTLRQKLYYELAKEVKEMSKYSDISLIEIATTNHDFFFKNFDKQEIKKMIFIEIKASLEECLDRNKKRRDASKFNSFVPESYIHSFYKWKNEKIDLNFSHHVEVLNSSLSLKEFGRKIIDLTSQIGLTSISSNPSN